MAMAATTCESQEHDRVVGSRKVKVTILASEWGLSKGGLSTTNRELAIQLAKFPEVEITFFLPQCSHEDKKVALSHNVTIVEATRRPGFEELEWLSFPPEHLQIDIIVGHGVKLGHQAQVIRDAKNCAWIQVVHTDPEELGMFKNYPNPISKGEEKHKTEVELCEMADLVVGVGPKLSEAFRSYLRGCQKDENILDFTPGIFDEFLDVQQVPEESGKQRIVLVFGRGDAEDFELKGFDIAGKAVAELPDTRLVFVGAPDGKHEEIAKRLIGCGVPANRLRVRGFVQSRESLRRLFQEVDLALMPSRTEGFGLTGLEALSAGLPVLVSKNSGFGEAIDKVPFDSSFVIDSEDPSEWAKAIKKIWNKDRKKRLEEAEAVRDSYAKKYNWDKQIKDVVHKMTNIVLTGQVSSRTEDNTEDQAVRSIFPDLEKMQCDTDKANNKTNLPFDLRKIASDKGFTVSDNQASGNCMFYALSEQVQSVKGVQISHRQLKKTLVQFLMDNSNLHDGTPLFNFVSGYPSWTGYLGSMANDGIWGDHLVLRAAANHFQTGIRIISSLGRDILISPEIPVANTNPLVLGHVHELHYVSLQPKQDASASYQSSTQRKRKTSQEEIRKRLDSKTKVRKTGDYVLSSNAATDPESIFMERTNYSRLSRLVISVGSQVLRDTFDRIIPPQHLQSVLKRHPAHSELQSLRKKGILNSMQWSKLFPTTPSEVSSAGFDPALLIVLLRRICHLNPPPAGWDAPPHTSDTSCESDIARVKYFMNAVSEHAGQDSVSDVIFLTYWQQIRDALVRLGGADYEDAVDAMKDQVMDPMDEEHFKELLKQWKKVEDIAKDKLNELESVDACKEEDVPHPIHVIETIRQRYLTSEERVLPVPWSEDFSFHLNDIFTRLKIVNKKKTRGAVTDEITSMTSIFKAHADCEKPRTVLIEGEPGMGKTTYCQKLAYDWATKQSFLEIEVLLLLKCHDIESDVWKAIEEQILPLDIDDEAKESFFEFIRKNQSKVMFVLDGLDEAEPSKEAIYFNLVEGRELTGCYMVLTSRQETGRKVRRFCDTWWEIVGFTKKDAEKFIHKYFKDMEHLAETLIVNISSSRDLRELTQNPLNAALLCVIWEDFKGIFPSSRAQLYIEIALFVLRRYENKYGISSKTDDLMTEYKKELKYLGQMALQSLRKGELYFEEHEFDVNSIQFVLSKFGFLSIQAGGSKRKPSSRYGFLHKSFQEFFAGLYLAFLIIDGEIDCDSVVTDQRYWNELNHVFLFMGGILASQSEEAAVSLVKNITKNINLVSRASGRDVGKHLGFALHCISECITNKENIPFRLLHTLGVHLDVKTLKVCYEMRNTSMLFFEAFAANSSLKQLDLRWNRIGPTSAASLSRALAANSSLTNLNLSYNEIGSSGAACLFRGLAANSSLTVLNLTGIEIGPPGDASIFQALAANSFLTHLDLSGNEIGPSGAAFLFQALAANSSLIDLNLSRNEIGPSGDASIFQALAANSFLTHLDLSENEIGPSGAAFLFQTLAANSSLTDLNLSENEIGLSGDASLFQALVANSSLTHLDLNGNKIGPSGAAFLFQALAANSSLTDLNLSGNEIGLSGDASLFQALAANSSFTHLDLSGNEIGPSGAASLFQALAANSSLTHLNLEYNEIGLSGAVSLFKALAANSSLTHLNLISNKIGSSGAASLFQALAANSSLTDLNLSGNEIGLSGDGSLFQALAANSSLTHLDLRGNEIGPSCAASLFQALAANSSLTHLELSSNKIGSSSAAPLFQALAANSSLTHLNLGYNNIGPPGAASLFQALAANSSLTHLNLCWNKIVPSGAASPFQALAANSPLTHLDLSSNKIGPSGAAYLFQALAANSSLTHLNLTSNKIGSSGVASLPEALAVNSSLTHLNLEYNEIGLSGAVSLFKALAVNSSLTHLNLRYNGIGPSGAAVLSEACKVNTTVQVVYKDEGPLPTSFHDDDDIFWSGYFVEIELG